MNTTLVILIAGIGFLLWGIKPAAILFDRFLLPRRKIMKAHKHAPVEHEDVRQDKYPEADVGILRGLIMSLSFILVFVSLLLLFNFEVAEKKAVVSDSVFAEPAEIEIVPQTVQQPNIPPPPEAQAALMIGYEVTEVADDEVIGEVELFVMDEDLDEEISDVIYSVDGVKGGTLTDYIADEEEEEDPLDREIFVIVEENPSFPGGEDSMYIWLNKNTKYPVVARESGIQGKVYVEFVVTYKGDIANAKVMRGIGGGCDEEALRVVNSFPKWEPGKQRGRPVNVKFTLPIFFIIPK